MTVVAANPIVRAWYRVVDLLPLPSMRAQRRIALAALLALSLSGALAEGTVNVFNWEDYINEDAIALFEEETGIKVNYMRFTLNEDMLVQVRTSPGAAGTVVSNLRAMGARTLLLGVIGDTGEGYELRFLEQDLLAPLLEARQEEAGAAGDGTEIAAGTQ